VAHSLVKTGIKVAGVWTESKRIRMRDLTAGAGSVLGGATSKTNAAASPNVATAQAITGQATTSAMWWDALQCRDHAVATRWRSYLIATEIISD